MTQKDDFLVGMAAGAVIWLFYISGGNTVTNSPSPIDEFLKVIYPDVALVKSLLFFALFGGVLGVLASRLKEKVMR